MTVEPALDRLATAVAIVLHVPRVLITALDESRQVLEGAHGLTTAMRSTLTEADPSPLCREVAAVGRPLILPDVRSKMPTAARDAWGRPIGGYAGVPLVASRGEVTGTLAAITPTRRAWQRRDLLVLDSFAHAISAVREARELLQRYRALERSTGQLEDEAFEVADHAKATDLRWRKATEALATTALHDELTGLLNRRGFFLEGDRQIDHARATRLSGSVLFVDLDGLKAANDRHGHAAGDELLRAAATVLRSCFRNSDTIARLGGDEFVVVAVDVNPDETSTIAARLTAELERVNRQRDAQLQLKWSLGVVPIDPRSPDNLEQLVVAADRQMYQNKHDHRHATRRDDRGPTRTKG